ncbi:MAG: CDP-alcohol phosphatidyltransferase family protein [Alkalispirochaetaceae bacterium]
MSARFDRSYRLWTYLHSVTLLIITVAMTPLFVIPEALLFWFLVPYTLGILTLLYLSAGWGEGRGADLLTATRGAAAALVFLWAALLPLDGSLGATSVRWFLLALIVAAEATDFFDGRLARRRGCREFGAIWDMENDALFIFALTLVGYVHLRFPAWTLLIGLMRYLYFLLFRLTGDPPGYPMSYKWFAKSVAATIAISLLVSYIPGLSTVAIISILAPVLILQSLSFSWDLILQARAGRLRSALLREQELPRKMETWR